jgi:hypothetical protein
VAVDTDFGVDLAGILDVGSTLVLTSGRRALAEAILRRLTTPRGSLFYDFDYGFDLRQFISAPEPQPGFLEMQVRTEVEKDERVESVEVETTFISETLTARLTVTDADGTFKLTLAVTNLTVEYLAENT